MTHDVIARARIRPMRIVRPLVLLIALFVNARDAAPRAISDFRKRGLDIVLAIDGTGSMNLIIDDLKAAMPQLVQSVHQIVPIARFGIIVFGGRGEKMTIQPLTLSAQKLSKFLNAVHSTSAGDESEEDSLGACQAAMEKSDWNPSARKMLILVGDSPPQKEDFTPLLVMIRKFKGTNGTFNAVDVAAEEHERFEREFYLKHPEKAPTASPLPEFYRQTSPAYKVLAAAGGGEMHELSRDVSINRAIFLIIAKQSEEPPSQIPPGRLDDYIVPIADTPFDLAPCCHSPREMPPRHLAPC